MGGDTVEVWTKKYSEHYYNRLTQFSMIIDLSNTNVMLGDSLTEHGNWNELLNIDNVSNRGISGDTSDGLADRINMLNVKYKKAFIMIGVNDFSKNYDVENVYNNYIKIIELLVLKEITPYIQSTILTGISRAKLHNNKIIKLNKLLKEYCLLNNYVYIDLNKKLTDKKLLKSIYSFDGLHLNGNGYKIWTETIFKYIGE